MNILFVSGRVTPPLFFGGAEISARILAKQLSNQGYNLTFLGSYSHPKHGTNKELIAHCLRNLSELGIGIKKNNNDVISYRFEKIFCIMTSIETLPDNFHLCIDNFKPYCVITMLEGAPVIVNACRKSCKPSITWIHDVYPVGLQPLYEKPTAVLYTSEFVRQQGIRISGKDGLLFYPPFEKPRPFDTKEKKKRFITMINPIPEKGGNVFLDLARLFPEKEFLAVEGWRRSELWDSSIPSNVLYYSKRQDLVPVWQKTKLLLVPSTMEEGFGRVVVEAGLYGVPSIASARGGLPEAVGNGGILIYDDFLSEWAAALRQTDDLKLWIELSNRSMNHARKFLDNPVSKLINSGVIPNKETSKICN